MDSFGLQSYPSHYRKESIIIENVSKIIAKLSFRVWDRCSPRGFWSGLYRDGDTNISFCMWKFTQYTINYADK